MTLFNIIGVSETSDSGAISSLHFCSSYVRCRIQQPQSEQPGLLKRMADGLSGMFRGAGGTYTQGQQQSDYSGFAGGGGAAP